jgi:tetratricopeptide (TPR) repeat protein
VSELKTTTSTTWTNGQAFALAAVSLLLGVSGGWLIRRFTAGSAPAQTASVSVPSQTAVPSQPPPANFGVAGQLPSSQDLKQAADAQAAPLLEQLKASPTNAGLLAQVGNLYYDAKQYPTAIDYYERSLRSQPADTSVRTDLGTAYWYNGDADMAITQFNKALTYEPTKADTLFNLGIVKLQGKKDATGAIAAWQKLLDTNPGYQQRDQVMQLMAQAQAQNR